MVVEVAAFSLGLLDVVVLRVAVVESVSSLVRLVGVGSSSRIFLIRSRLCLRFSSLSERNVATSMLSKSKISK